MQIICNRKRSLCNVGVGLCNNSSRRTGFAALRGSDLFLCIHYFILFGHQFLLRQLGTLLEAELAEDGKMVRAEISEAAEIDQPEMVRVEQVVERESEKRYLCVKGVVKAAADARVKEAADVLEKVVRPRPGDVVQIAENDKGEVILPVLAANDDYFRVAGHCIPEFGRGRRPRMEAAELDQVARPQTYTAVDRRDVVLNEKTYQRADQFEA